MADPRDTDQTKEAFLARVIDEAPEVRTDAEAEQVARATLSALANAVSAGQISDLMPALPPGLAPEGTAVASNAQQVDKSAFLDQVGGASGSTDVEVVERQVRAVLTTLTRWAPNAQISATLDQLPADIREMFGTT